MDKQLYLILKEINKERLLKEKHERSTLDYKVRMLYANFWLWCKAFEQDENDYKNFKVFLIETNQEINFWIKKKFLEKYFNFVFEFIHEKNKWFISNLNKYIGAKNGD